MEEDDDFAHMSIFRWRTIVFVGAGVLILGIGISTGGLSRYRPFKTTTLGTSTTTSRPEGLSQSQVNQQVLNRLDELDNASRQTNGRIDNILNFSVATVLSVFAIVLAGIPLLFGYRKKHLLQSIREVITHEVSEQNRKKLLDP